MFLHKQLFIQKHLYFTHVIKFYFKNEFQDPESLCEQYNEEFLLFASHLNNSSLLFPRKPRGEVCVGIDCPCLLDQYVTFKERVRDNKDRFKNVWFTKNAADQMVWNTTNVLSYFQKTKYSLHDGIADVVEIIEICLAMSRSQSDTERCGKLLKDVSENRFGGKYNETYHGENKMDQVNEEMFLYANSVPLHHLPLEELRKEWEKSHLPAILRTKPGKESSTLTKLWNKEQNIKFWFDSKSNQSYVFVDERLFDNSVFTSVLVSFPDTLASIGTKNLQQIQQYYSKWPSLRRHLVVLKGQGFHTTVTLQQRIGQDCCCYMLLKLTVNRINQLIYVSLNIFI